MSAPRQFLAKYGGRRVMFAGKRSTVWQVVYGSERPAPPWTAILSAAQVKRVKAHADRFGVPFVATPVHPTAPDLERKARPVKKRAGKRSHLFTSTNQPRRRRR